MKLRAILCLVGGIGLLSLTDAVGAIEGTALDLIPRSHAERVGLTVQWTSHVQVNPSMGKVACLRQHVNSSKLKTVFEVSFGKRKQQFSETHLNPFGEIYGVEGARKAAQDRVDQLQQRGIEAEIKEVVLPEISLYALTDMGVIHAFDAETGETRWAVSIGRKDHPPLPFDVNDDTVAAVSCSSLVVLNAKDGSLRYRQKLDHASGSGPAITSQFAFVPHLNGTIEVFDLYDSEEPSQRFVSTGRNFIQPMANQRIVAWPNDRKQMMVAFSHKVTNVAYRMKAGRDFLSQPVELGEDRLVAASSDGFVHCVETQNGTLDWECNTGERINQKLFVIDDIVYAITSIDQLYRIPSEKQDFDLVIPGVRQIVAASPTRIYARGIANELIIIDRSSGAVLSRVATRDLNLWYTNELTDRIFVGTESGTIQCLREIGATHPVLPKNMSASEEGSDGDSESDDAESEGAGNPFRARSGG